MVQYYVSFICKWRVKEGCVIYENKGSTEDVFLKSYSDILSEKSLIHVCGSRVLTIRCMCWFVER